MLPQLAPMSPLGRLPGQGWLGNRFFLAAARRRDQCTGLSLSCTAHGCAESAATMSPSPRTRMNVSTDILELLACPRCDRRSTGRRRRCAARAAASTSHCSARCLGCSRSPAPRSANGAAACISLCSAPSASENSCAPRSSDRELARRDARHGSRCSRTPRRITASGCAPLLAPLELERNAASIETHLALRTRLPVGSRPHDVLPQHAPRLGLGRRRERSIVPDRRRRARGCVARARARARRGRRHGSRTTCTQRCAASPTVALDFNPLLVLLAQRIARGEHVELHEFPIARAQRGSCGAAHARGAGARPRRILVRARATRIGRRSGAARSTRWSRRGSSTSCPNSSTS